jgi:hypothetical protein
MNRLPFSASIPKPCHQQWTAMSGTASTRHCDSCQKTVHNFAALTPRQIERLIHESKGHLCARITRREDGSIVTGRESSTFLLEAASFVAAALLAISTPVFAQSTTKPPANLTGSIVDETGAPIAGAQVKLLDADHPPTGTRTDAQGKFYFDTPAGRHHLQATAPGFAPRSLELEVNNSPLTLQPVVMKVQALMGDLVVVSSNGLEPLEGAPSTTMRFRDSRPWYSRFLSGTRNLLHL